MTIQPMIIVYTFAAFFNSLVPVRTFWIFIKQNSHYPHYHMIFNAENVAEIIKIRQKIELFYFYQRVDAEYQVLHCSSEFTICFVVGVL
jgi:hypothetical protein